MGIDLRELRIGNLVTINGEVHAVDIELYHNTLAKFQYVPYDAIPITHEILEWFGFKKVAGSQGYYYEIDGFRLVWGTALCLETNVDGIKTYYIKTVHQLQNIYFALTTKELPCQ